MRPSGNHTKNRRGVGVVELLVAVVVLVVGILGLVATASLIARQLGAGARLTRAGAVGQSRLETLAALPCERLGGAASGRALAYGLEEHWTVQRTGAAVVIADTVRWSTPRGERSVGWSSLRAC